ncbi:hypothetical protein SEVIR_3G003200v4 [Setaria viridis]|uniref:Uncharacterized protein n=1 Tax=Setaria viridis TaxID=4556 RepID=A0A4U6V3R0_SETVI|nr:hypothetical protein SEVIR_3G003200v2 [Setaria viridis]
MVLVVVVPVGRQDMRIVSLVWYWYGTVPQTLRRQGTTTTTPILYSTCHTPSAHHTGLDWTGPEWWWVVQSINQSSKQQQDQGRPTDWPSNSKATLLVLLLVIDRLTVNPSLFIGTCICIISISMYQPGHFRSLQ